MNRTFLNDIPDLQFVDKSLLQQALTHPSYINEHPENSVGSNQRLEFLGDAILALVVAHELFLRNPNLAEGELTKIRSHLVNGRALANLARSIALGEHLRLGQGENSSGGRDRDSNLAATLEAIIGAVFVERGYRAAQKFIVSLMSPELGLSSEQVLGNDPKIMLQELLQFQGQPPPQYSVTKTEGPDHAPKITVKVTTITGVSDVGTGSRKLDAERSAAKKVYTLLTDTSSLPTTLDDTP